MGGYDDWAAQRPAREEQRSRAGASGRARRRAERPAGPKKLTYAQRLELDDLPGRIEDLEGRIAKVHEEMADPDLYKGGGEEIRRLQIDLERLEGELEEVFGRWETLETIKERSGE